MPKLITTKNEGEVRTHIFSSQANFVTLCGEDGDDPDIDQSIVPTPKGAKIDCHHCVQIWLTCRNVSRRLIDPST